MKPTIMHWLNDEAQSNDAGVKRIELPKMGALHGILLKVKATNGSTGGRAKNIFTDVLDKIEIRGDSSKILFSQYPKDFEKWYETQFGRGLQMVEKQDADGVQECVFPIMFGREMVDKEMYLPLSRYDRTTLELEYSPTIAADSGFATGTVTFDVVLVVSTNDADLNYQGTLITRTYKEHTTLASGVEPFELPTDTVIRMIGNYCYEAGVADGSNITALKLSDKSRGITLFDVDWPDLINLNRELFGSEITHYAKLLLTNNETYISRIGEILNISVEMEETPDTTNDEVDIVHVDGIAGDTLTFDVSNVKITAGAETITNSSTDRAIRVAVLGKSPSYFGFIPYNFKDEPDGYLHVGRDEQLQIDYTQGNAGGQLYTTLQELERL